VYSLSSFLWLADFFAGLETGYEKIRNRSKTAMIGDSVQPEIREFMDRIGAEQKIADLIGATASYTTFHDRFFAWFNGFMVLRYLNELHLSAFSKSPVFTEASALAQQARIPEAKTLRDLLLLYRQFERSRGIRRIT
jgi:hypothetical protein